MDIHLFPRYGIETHFSHNTLYFSSILYILVSVEIVKNRPQPMTLDVVKSKLNFSFSADREWQTKEIFADDMSDIWKQKREGESERLGEKNLNDVVYEKKRSSFGSRLSDSESGKWSPLEKPGKGELCSFFYFEKFHSRIRPQFLSLSLAPDYRTFQSLKTQRFTREREAVARKSRTRNTALSGGESGGPAFDARERERNVGRNRAEPRAKRQAWQQEGERERGWFRLRRGWFGGGPLARWPVRPVVLWRLLSRRHPRPSCSPSRKLHPPRGCQWTIVHASEGRKGPRKLLSQPSRRRFSREARAIVSSDYSTDRRCGGDTIKSETEGCLRVISNHLKRSFLSCTCLCSFFFSLFLSFPNLRIHPLNPCYSEFAKFKKIIRENRDELSLSVSRFAKCWGSYVPSL